jgi:drug/metabolite transporter (DMT)-like permease
MAAVFWGGWRRGASFAMGGGEYPDRQMTKKLTMTASDWLLLIILSVLFGGAFFFAEIAVREVPPMTLAFARCAIASAVLLVYARAMGFSLPSGRSVWLGLAVLAILNTVIPFTLIFWGQTHIPSGLAAILNATAPIFSILIAHFATADDKLSVRRVVGIVIGFAGVVIVIGIEALRELGLEVLAQLAVVIGAFFYAIAGVYGRRFKAYPPSVISAAILMLGAFMLLPISGFAERAWELSAPSWAAVASTVALGVFSTALAFLIYVRVLGRAGAVNFQLVAYLIPVSAILLGVGFLGETLEWRHIIGMCVIAIGLMVIDGRAHQALLRAMKGAPKEA